jgi:hypothetical protein
MLGSGRDSGKTAVRQKREAGPCVGRVPAAGQEPALETSRRMTAPDWMSGPITAAGDTGHWRIRGSAVRCAFEPAFARHRQDVLAISRQYLSWNGSKRYALLTVTSPVRVHTFQPTPARLPMATPPSELAPAFPWQH